jgi:hypothetical protein
MARWIIFGAVGLAAAWLWWLGAGRSEGDSENRGTILKGLLIGIAAGTCVGLVGFFLATIPSTRGMGATLFFVVPFCAGFAISMVTRGSNTSLAAALLSVLASLTFLVMGKMEGVLCAFMAFPLLLSAIAIGTLAGYLFRRHVVERLRHQMTGVVTVFALVPAVILAGHQFELPALRTVRREIISNSILVTASPEEVWTNIQSIDSLAVPKPWLMNFGLPTPLRCTLERQGVGAKRTCYFDQGFIEETITGWSPPYSLQLTVDRSNMPGRHWLGFENAAYDLRREGSDTRLTRTTTITSHLYPVWYWRGLERLGVASEHEYILRDVANRLRK